jgi:hypothetical protein
MKRRDKVIIISVFGLIPVFYFFHMIMMLNTKESCATVIRDFKIKGSRNIEYTYLVNNKTIKVHSSSMNFKIKDLDSLKKLGCFKIKYSTFWNVHNEIIDKRVVK